MRWRSWLKIPWGGSRSALQEWTRKPPTLETAMTFTEHATDQPGAVHTNLGAIFVSLELSRSTWLITSLSPGGGEKMSKHQLRSGDVAGLLARFSQLQAKAGARTGRAFPIVVIHEAGLDGFCRRSGLDRHLAPPPTRQDRPDRRRGSHPGAAGLQAWRAAGLRDGEGADARGGRPSPDLS